MIFITMTDLYEAAIMVVILVMVGPLTVLTYSPRYLPEVYRH